MAQVLKALEARGVYLILAILVRGRTGSSVSVLGKAREPRSGTKTIPLRLPLQLKPCALRKLGGRAELGPDFLNVQEK